MDTLTRWLARSALLLSSLAAAPARAHGIPAATQEVFPRLRFGAAAGVGMGTCALAFGASARVGVQVMRELAVSYQVSAAAALKDGLQFIGNGPEDGWTSHAILVEYTMPGLILGLGPAVTRGTMVGATSAFGSSAGWSSSYSGIGLEARVGLVLGPSERDERGGVTLELAVHASEHDAILTFGIGFDLY